MKFYFVSLLVSQFRSINSPNTGLFNKAIQEVLVKQLKKRKMKNARYIIFK